MDPTSDPATHGKRHAWLIVATMTALAGVAYSLIRLPDAQWWYPTFEGACARLKESGLPILPTDSFCIDSWWRPAGSIAVVSGLAWLALAVPCMVLATTGRRLMALLPAIVAPTIYIAFEDGWWGSPIWRDRPAASALMNLGLIVLPAVVVMATRTRRREGVPRPPRLASVGAGLLCLAVSFGFVALVWRTAALVEPLRAWRAIYSYGTTIFRLIPWALVPAIVSIGFFGGLLGRDRRWSPWALALSALLLSLGLPAALSVFEPYSRNWSLFGSSIALFGVGWIWSYAPTLAARLGRSPKPLSARPTVHRHAVVAANLVLALLLLATIPVAGETTFFRALPTYLAEREAVQDFVTDEALAEVAREADRFRAATGSYLGFGSGDSVVENRSRNVIDATHPISAAPAPASGAAAVTIARARRDEIRLVAVSDSGIAMCLRTRGPGRWTHGTSLAPSAARDLQRIARAHCSDTSWEPSAVAHPESFMCDGPGYILCRMVQVLTHNMVRAAHAPGAGAGEIDMPHSVLPGEIYPKSTLSGLDLVVTRDENGALVAIDPVSSHRPSGIGYPTQYCPGSGVFVDEHGSMFDQFGGRISGPAPSGLDVYRATRDGETIWIDPVPTPAKGPGRASASRCLEEDLTPVLRARDATSTPHEAFTVGALGGREAFAGVLVVDPDGDARMEPVPQISGPEGRREGYLKPVPVRAIDGDIADGRGQRRIPAVWRAEITPNGFSDLVHLSDLPAQEPHG